MYIVYQECDLEQLSLNIYTPTEPLSGQRMWDDTKMLHFVKNILLVVMMQYRHYI